MAIKKEIKAYIETEIRDYDDTLRAIGEERNDLILSSPTHENIGGTSYDISNPTLDKAIKLRTNKRIRRMEQTCEAIAKVIDALPDEKLRLVELKYWAKPQTLTDAGIYMQLNIEKTCYYEWINQIVGAVGVEMGIVDPDDVGKKNKGKRSA